MKLPTLPMIRDTRQRRSDQFYSDMIHFEARLGGTLFGPIPEGTRREFFCLDEHTWVWHEEWIDAQGQRRALTTRYDIRPAGILKSQGGQHYQALSKEEAKNLLQATRLYAKEMHQALPKFALAR